MMLFNMDELSMLAMATGIIPKDATCRTCKHRERFELNYHSSKIVQCCVKRPSKRSNSGFRTIKVTDRACYRYEMEE